MKMNRHVLIRTLTRAWTSGLALLTALLLGAINSHGAAKTASVSGDWTSTTTWGGSAVPTTSDTVTINSGVTVTVTTTTPTCAYITSLVGTIDIKNGGMLTLPAAGGNVNCTIAATGTLTVEQGGTFTATEQSASGISMTSGSVINNSGTISLTTPGSGNLYTITGTGTVNNQATGVISQFLTFNPIPATVTINHSVGSTFVFTGGDLRGLNNYSYQNLTFNLTSAFAMSLNNGFTVNGTLWLEAGSLPMNSKTFTFGNGATIRRTSGSLTGTGTFAYGTTGINVTYDGTTATMTGAELPTSTANKLVNLTNNNPAGIVLNANAIVNGTFATVYNGSTVPIAAGANTLTFVNSPIVVTATSGLSSGSYTLVSSSSTTVSGSLGTVTVSGTGGPYTASASTASGQLVANVTSVTFAATQLVITSSPVSTTAGVSSSVITVQRQDSGNNPITSDPTIIVNLASSSGAGIFRDPTDSSTITSVSIPNGSSSATFLYRDPSAGTPTITASTSPLTSGTQQETVTPAAIASYVVTASTPQQTGAPFNTTVTAKDQYNNTVTTDNSTLVTMTSSGSAVFDGNGNGTFGEAGDNQKTLSSGAFTISTKDNTSETITLTATDGNGKTGTSGNIVVGAASTFTKLQLLVPGETAAPGTPTGMTGTPNPVTNGIPFNVTVNAVDANWNVVSTVTDTVGLSSSDGGAVLPANATLVGGTMTFTGVQLKTPPSQTLTATDISNGTEAPSTSPAITVVSTNTSNTNNSYASVNVNWNTQRSVGGVSDFGRERHINVHSDLQDNDWIGSSSNMNYLMNGLNVYFGRDNGQATFYFQETTNDPANPNHPSLASMTNWGNYWISQYDSSSNLAYASRQNSMIMGTNPHPTYPTLDWYSIGYTFDGWQPKDVQTSASWVANYLDLYFSHGSGQPGEPLPKYWEVINEPDMDLMTGQFMVTSWENLWKYHNLVAQDVRAELGTNAPLIGGMTFGLHDFYQPDLNRYSSNYLAAYLDPTTEAFYENASVTAYPYTGQPWEQWDKIWKGFIDHCGTNMDFYSIHLYDWPSWGLSGSGHIRTGGQVEATLDMLEWYDINKFGLAHRHPLVVSEYGAVAGYQSVLGLDPKRRDWENLKPFNAMLMEFLDRPDWIVKTMPFTPIKAQWGDYTSGNTLYRYPYTMMNTNAAGQWVWTDYIMFYQLWSNVDGTRVDTDSTNLNVQADAYVNGNSGFLILNNLSSSAQTVQINQFGATNNTISSVEVKNLWLNPALGVTNGEPELDDNTVATPPGSVTLNPNATMILRYNFANPVTINQSCVETNYWGDSLSGSNGDAYTGGTPFRLTVPGLSTLTAHINNVTVPTGPAQAMLRIDGLFWWQFMTNYNDTRNQISINGHALPYPHQFLGDNPGVSQYFGVLEVPVPISYLQASNTITSVDVNSVTYTTVSLQVRYYSALTNSPSSPAQPVITSARIVGGNIILQITNGVPSGDFDVLSATNVALTAGNWTTNQAGLPFDNAGTATVTNPVSGTQQYFRIRQ